MESPDGVVVPLGEVVEIPSVPHVVALHHVQVFLHPGVVHRPPDLPEPDIDQNPEKPPVVLRHVVLVDLVQPPVQVFPLPRRQLLPEPLRREADPRADDRHLHHPLVVVIQVAPVFLVLRIRPVDQAFPPQLPEGLRLRAFPRQHGHDGPQGPAPALHARHVLGIVGGPFADVHPGPAGGQAFLQRLQQRHRRPYHVLPRLQGILTYRIHDIFLLNPSGRWWRCPR